MSVGEKSAETLICYCFEVTEAQIRESMQALDLQTAEQVAAHTSAGTGCTACHCRIRRMLAGLPVSCQDVETCATCGFASGQCDC